MLDLLAFKRTIRARTAPTRHHQLQESSDGKAVGTNMVGHVYHARAPSSSDAMAVGLCPGSTFGVDAVISTRRAEAKERQAASCMIHVFASCRSVFCASGQFLIHQGDRKLRSYKRIQFAQAHSRPTEANRCGAASLTEVQHLATPFASEVNDAIINTPHSALASTVGS